MYQNQQSTTGSNRTMVPEAKQALNLSLIHIFFS